ncbi:hypothetical protein ACFE04_001191 [Oxalis oulophora]
MESKVEKLKDTVVAVVDKCLDSQLWHACAGGMVHMPSINSNVFYFPQGHAEHSCGPVDFRACSKTPSYVLCRVSNVKFMADPETDEVFAKMTLVPVSKNPRTAGGGCFELDCGGDIDGGVGGGGVGGEGHEKPASFAKTLTQSDANNGGGFSVPRYCAETIFPRLDYSADPPVQTILAKDVHGETWKFRHIYRGTPRRHLLTTGWSSFVNHKKLVAGDSIVFLRAENGDLCVGIRRAKRGGNGPEAVSVTGWNPGLPYGGFTAFLRDDESKPMRNGNVLGGNLSEKGKVKPESVIEAATLAANGQPFEIVYYPRASTPEFCVKAPLVKAAMQIRWCSGMRFKMAFETEDSSRISWFMGTISFVQAADPIRWPDSPWRLLQVSWDEPDLLQNVKRVSPWLVELVSNMPAIHLSPFAQTRKKLRLNPHPDFTLDGGQIPIPNFSGNHHLLGPASSPFGCLPENNSPAGMQGARHHAHYGLSLSDLQLNKLQSGLFSVGFPPIDHHHQAVTPPPKSSNGPGPGFLKPSMSENVSCLLTMSSSSPPKKNEDPKAPQLVLFGQPILTEQQISLSSSGDTVSSIRTENGLSDSKRKITVDSEWETGHCKVFMESEDVGRTLDLSLLGSYNELSQKLTEMFGVETLSHVLYRDTKGTVKHVGNEPFSEFTKTARRLTILTNSGSENLGK